MCFREIISRYQPTATVTTADRQVRQQLSLTQNPDSTPVNSDTARQSNIGRPTSRSLASINKRSELTSRFSQGTPRDRSPISDAARYRQFASNSRPLAGTVDDIIDEDYVAGRYDESLNSGTVHARSATAVKRD